MTDENLEREREWDFWWTEVGQTLPESMPGPAREHEAFLAGYGAGEVELAATIQTTVSQATAQVAKQVEIAIVSGLAERERIARWLEQEAMSGEWSSYPTMYALRRLAGRLRYADARTIRT